MKSIEYVGKSVQEAIDQALLELNLSIEEVEYEVLEQGSKGFLGLIGSKPAKIQVVVKEKANDIAEKFIKDLFESIDKEVSIDIDKKDGVLNISLDGEDMGFLIGKRGETLDAIQFLTSLVVNKEKNGYQKVLLDVGDYRKKREESLVRFANKVARTVAKTKRKIKLEPMNPYERRIIHSALQEDRYVTTYSEGEEPERKIVIALKKR